MNKSIVVGAVAMLAAAVALPLPAFSQNPPPAAGQVMPPEHPQPAAPTGAVHPAMGPWMPRAGGPMMHAGWRAGMMQPGMMWRRRMMMMRMDPQHRCDVRLARRAAHTAYVVSMLDLTQAQQPLYDKLRSALDAAASRQHQLCATLKPADQQREETILDRLARREQLLQAHLQDLQQVQPALQALYQSLTPAQKAIIDHPFHRG